MTRNGKIARLPREIRDELNQRLDNGEQGVELVAWLNQLPEVKEALNKQFNGRPINEVNLTEWKNGGYVEWQAQQTTMALAQEFKATAGQWADLGGAELTECLKNAVAAHYAARLQGWNGEMTDEMKGILRGLRGLSREVVRLRRSDREFEQMQLDREALELKKQQTTEGIRKKFEEWAADTDFQDRITPKMTKEEKERELYRLIYGRDKEEMERERAEAKARLKAGRQKAEAGGQKEQSNVHPSSQGYDATSSPKPNIHPPSSDFGVTGGPKSTGTGTVPEPAGVDACATPEGSKSDRSADSGRDELNPVKPN